MAFQRPFLISLKRSEPQQPWGFRVFGGKDYEESHVVQKVVPDSVAEHSGLREGDEIIQIGRVNIQDLTFNQVQELIARCGNRIEMFIIREDLLTPRSGKEPPCIKAVVHNPYNSPLQLYSTENIADTLAKQTEVLTDGRISSADEEEAPENLTFKQKSAVFHLLEEQAKQDTVSPVYPRGSPQRKVPPPPPPKPKPPAQVNHYEEVQTPRSPQRHTTTAVITPTQPQPQPQFVQPSQPSSNQTATISFKVSSKTYSSPPADQYQSQPTAKSSATFKVGPPPPPRGSSQSQTAMTTVQRQQQQQYHHQTQYQQYQYSQQEQQPYNPQQQQQMDYQQQTRRQQEVHQTAPQYQTQPQYQQQQYQHQPQYQQQKQSQPQPQYQQPQPQYQQPQPQYQQRSQHQPSQYQPSQYQQPQYQQQERESIFEPVPETPITYKAPPPQKYKVAWPPPQNGNLTQMSPSPTPQSPSKMPIESVWPPRQPTVKELPKTGFNPAVLRDQGTGRKCVWPPPKTDDELRSGRTTPQSPVGGRRVNWNPSPSPPTTRRIPFGSISPQTRRKDISWPPPQPQTNKENLTRGSPRLGRKSDRFEDHVKQQASNNVPVTYRPPPGTSFRTVYS